VQIVSHSPCLSLCMAFVLTGPLVLDPKSSQQLALRSHEPRGNPPDAGYCSPRKAIQHFAKIEVRSPNQARLALKKPKNEGRNRSFHI